MDVRDTISINETFIGVLSACKERNSKVSMLLDTKGLVSVEGVVKDIHLNDPVSYLILEGGLKIALKTIVGINGIFDPAFSEC